MKHLKILIILFLTIILSIQSAPVEEKQTLFDVISKDKRFEKLLNRKIIVECKTNKPICTSLIDVSLRFYEQKIDFSSSEVKDASDFCNSLVKILPDSPLDETTSLLKSFNVSWFKDIIAQENGSKCEDECTYVSFDDYDRKIKPVCSFIFNQYQLLESKSVKNETPKISEEVKSDEQIKGELVFCNLTKYKTFLFLIYSYSK